MKPGNTIQRRIILPLLAGGLVIALAAWGKHTPESDHFQQVTNDTPPVSKKKPVAERQVRDLDEMLEQMEALDVQQEMERAQLSVEKAMKELNLSELQATIQHSLSEVNMANVENEIKESLAKMDFSKIQKDISEAMAGVDFEKIQREVKESMAKVDISAISAEVQKALATINTEKIQADLRELRPELEKEMAKVKVDIKQAQEEIEKAKAEIKEYKVFVDGLDTDGLINKKGNYSLHHKDGKLLINDKEASVETYLKYKSFLEKHKKFNIEKSENDFDLN